MACIISENGVCAKVGFLNVASQCERDRRVYCHTHRTEESGYDNMGCHIVVMLSTTKRKSVQHRVKVPA